MTKIEKPDVMIDIETLGVSANCIVLTVGAAKFNPDTLSAPIEDFYMRLSIDEQEKMNRCSEADTIDWWLKQDDAVRTEAFDPDNRIDIATALTELSEFVKGSRSVWAQGPQFDLVILENLYQQYGMTVPWRYSRVRDSRTLFAVWDDLRDMDPEGKHNALIDCYNQIIGVQHCMVALNFAKAMIEAGP